MGLSGLFGRGTKKDQQAYMEVMVMLALADGEIEDSEIDDIITTIVSSGRMKGLTDRQLNTMFRQSIRDMGGQGMDTRLRAIAGKIPDREDRMEAMGMAISTSASDGEIEPQERAILEKMQRAFGLTDAEIDDILSKWT